MFEAFGLTVALQLTTEAFDCVVVPSLTTRVSDCIITPSAVARVRFSAISALFQWLTHLLVRLWLYINEF
jgi:hypothetical protein